MKYSIGRFRKEMKEAFSLAKKGEEVIIIRMKEPYLLVPFNEPVCEERLEKMKGEWLNPVQTKVVEELVEDIKEQVKFKQFVDTARRLVYSCGCKYKEGSKLCPKHDRV